MSALVIRFLTGVAILLIASHLLVRIAEKISLAFKISPLIVAITLVAIGTSIPKLAVSTTALYKHDSGLAMGNIVGSNIVNILLVFAVGILIGKLRVGSTKTQRTSTIVLITTIGFILFQILPINHITSGLILISGSILITVIEGFYAANGKNKEDFKMFKYKRRPHLGILSILTLIALIPLVILGSQLAVSAIEGISQLTGYSTAILGLSLTAIATSLPELLTTIVSQEEHQEKITVGNILGSNIYNLLLIGGIINLSSVKNGISPKDWVTLFLVTVFFVFILRRYSGKNIPRRYGFILLGGLILYLATLS